MPWETDPMESVLLLQRAAIVLLGGYNAAHFGAMWRRMGRQGAAAGEGWPGGTAAAGEGWPGGTAAAGEGWPGGTAAAGEGWPGGTAAAGEGWPGGTAAAGEGWPGGKAAAGERKRGRRIGAGVLALTNLGFVLTSGAQLAPTVEPWPAGIAALAGLVAMAAVGAMSVLVLRSRSRR